MLPRGGPQHFFGALTRANCAPPLNKSPRTPLGVRQRMEREDKGEKKGERAEREGKVGGRMERKWKVRRKVEIEWKVRFSVERERKVRRRVEVRGR